MGHATAAPAAAAVAAAGRKEVKVGGLSLKCWAWLGGAVRCAVGGGGVTCKMPGILKGSTFFFFCFAVFFWGGQGAVELWLANCID